MGAKLTIPKIMSGLEAKPQDDKYLHGFSLAEAERLLKQGAFKRDKVLDRISFRPGSRVLECPCGVGAQTYNLLETFPDIELVAADWSLPSLELAQKHCSKFGDRVTFVHADATMLRQHPFFAENHSFDAAVSTMFFEHLFEPRKAAAELFAVLKPGAPLFSTECFSALLYLLPRNVAFQEYYAAYCEHQRSIGGDPDMGLNLRAHLVEVGFVVDPKDIWTVAFVVDKTTPEAKRALMEWAEDTLTGCAQKLQDAGRITPEQVTAMTEYLRHGVSAGYYGLQNLIARKPLC